MHGWHGHSLFYGTSHGEKLGQWNASFLPSQVCACVAHPESLREGEKPVPCLFEILGCFLFSERSGFLCRAVSFIIPVRRLRCEWWWWGNQGPADLPQHILRNRTSPLPATVFQSQGPSSPWGLGHLCSALFSQDHLLFQKQPRAAVFEMWVKGIVLFGELCGFLEVPGNS